MTIASNVLKRTDTAQHFARADRGQQSQGINNVRVSANLLDAHGRHLSVATPLSPDLPFALVWSRPPSRRAQRNQYARDGYEMLRSAGRCPAGMHC